MKTLLRILSTALISFASLAFGEARTFTESSSGRTINAEVVSATADSVTLKLESGATHTLPLARLSEADRTYVGDWAKQNPSPNVPAPTSAAAPAAAAGRFNVTWQKQKTAEKKVTLTPYSGEEEQWICKVNVSNLGNAPLENLEIRYQIHLSLERSGKVAVDEHVDGTTKIASLPRNQPVEVQTKAVPLLKLKLDSNYITTDGSRANKRDSLKGIAVGVFYQGALVHEYRSQGVPKVPFEADAAAAEEKKPE